MSARAIRRAGLVPTLSAIIASAPLFARDFELPDLLAPTGGGLLSVDGSARSALYAEALSFDAALRARRARGEAIVNTAFIPAQPTASARDGLGPLFNGASCESCHRGLRRAPAIERAGPAPAALVFQLSGRDAAGRAVPHPVYGSELNVAAVPGVPVEAIPRIAYARRHGRHDDGMPWTLRVPHYTFERLNYGPLDEARFSPRIASSLQGLGLLEAVPAAALLAAADPDDADGDGISGRANWIVDAAGRRRLGRFGWKANHPTLRAQIVAAFRAEQGLVADIAGGPNCSSHQAACLNAPHGGAPEIAAADLDAVLTFLRTVPVAARRHVDTPAVQRGAARFIDTGCAACHRPTLRTGAVAALPFLANQRIHAYTDLLLHDLGPGLADGRPDHAADGREWRTAPLWGLGFDPDVGRPTSFLHDGRARTLEEAILWHGGEAAAARRRYSSLNADARADLIAFLHSL
ncbi:MAG: di-heme oxidoredictase family protein [Gammaproteobacteria bacterium]